MNNQEIQKLKKILKPLIKECIKEAIFEEGVLSTLVAEVATGMGATTIVEETRPEPRLGRETSKRLQESKRKMREAISSTAYGSVDIFEGTEPLSTSGATPSHSPLANVDPKDKGVNIDSLVSLFGNKWDALK